MYLKTLSYLMMPYKVNAILFLVFISLLTISSVLVQDGEKTLFLIGDSTVADKPYSNGNPEKGWGQVFPLYFKPGIKVENHAVNGRSTKSFRDEGRWDVVLNRLQPGDYVIIEFGHNDQKSHDTTRYAAAETDYRKNLIRCIDEAREHGGIPILATPIVRRRFDESGQFYDTHGLYPGVVREVAKLKNVPLLDLHVLTQQLLIKYGEERSKLLFLHILPGEYESLPGGREDDTHLSGVGAFVICDLVKSELSKGVPELSLYFKE